MYLGDTGNTQYSELIWVANGGVASIFKSGTGYASYGGVRAFNIYNQEGLIALHPNNTSNTLVASGSFVGIGTTNPSYKLDVKDGNIRITGSANEQLILDFASPTGNYTYQSFRLNGANKYRIFGYTSGDFTLYSDVSSTYPLYINAAGNVGINATNPAYKLDVTGKIYSNTEVQGGTAFMNDTGGITVFGSNTSTRSIRVGRDGTLNDIFITGSSGNVGIGLTNPAAKLEVDVTGNNNAFIVTRDTGTNGELRISFGGAIASYNSIQGGHKWFYNSSEKMHLDTSGNLGIGTTNPLSKLHVQGDIRASLANVSQANLVAYNTSTGLFTYLSTSSFAAVNIYNSDGTLDADRTVDNNSNNLTFINVQNYAIQTLPNNETSEVVYYDSSNGKLSYGGLPATAPAGSTTQIQYNNAGAFGASANFVFSGSRVGIGTPTPLVELHISASAGYSELRLDGLAGSGGSLEFYGTGSALADIYANPSKDLIFRTNGTTEQVRILANGNVGIGTTSPAYKLEVEGSIGVKRIGVAATSTIDMQGNFNFDAKSGYSHVFKQAGSELARILPSGNVGIGTASPIRDLQIGSLAATSTATPKTLSLGGTYSNSAGSNVKLRVYDDSTNIGGMSVSGGQMEVNTWSTGKLAFYRGTTQTMIIDATGNVGIGTTNPAGRLNVNVENAISTVTISRGGSDLTAGTALGNILFPADYSGTPTTYASIDAYANALSGLRGSLDFKVKSTSGNLLTGMTVYGTSAGVNVGIGTTAPVFKLDVTGTGRFTDTLRLDKTSTTYGEAALYIAGLNSYIDWNDGLVFRGEGSSWSARFTGTSNMLANGQILGVYKEETTPGTLGDVIASFNNDGNVGIRTSSPYAPLHVRVTGTPPTSGQQGFFGSVVLGGDASQWNRLRFDTAGTGSWGVAVNPNRQFAISRLDSGFSGTPDDDNFIIDTTGNIGIGLTTPTANLHINGDLKASLANVGQANVVAYNSSTGLFTYLATSSISSLPGGSDGQVQYNNGGVFGGASDLFYDDASGNVGVGTAAPTRQLDVYENSTVQIVAQFANSSSVSSRIKFADLNTGAENVNIGAIGTRMAMWTNNTERMSILSGGNVGIGRTTPIAPLHVSSSNWDNTSGGGVIFDNSSTVGASVTLRPLASVATNGTNGWAMYAGGPAAAILDGNLGFWAHGTNAARLVIQRGGNVGIGTNVPFAKLDIQGGSDGNVMISMGSNSVSGILNSPANMYINADSDNSDAGGVIAFGFNRTGFSGGAETMRLLENGNVGIGVVSPDGRLDVQQNTASFVLARVWNTNTSGTGASVIRIANSGNNINGGRIEFSDASYYTATISGDRTQGIVFRTSATGADPVAIAERMRITSGGDVGIGTTSPGAKLQIAGGTLDGGSLTDLGISSGLTTGRLGTFDASSLASISTRGDASSVELAAGSSATYYTGISATANNATLFAGTLRFFTSGSEKVRITPSGNVGIGTTSPSTTLDVLGKIKIDVDGTYGGGYGTIGFGGTTNGYNRVFGNNSTSDGLFLASATGRGIYFRANGGSTDHMAIISSGNVGIGTDNPSAKFYVNNSGGTGNPFYVNTGNSGNTTLFEHTGASTPVPFTLKKSGFSGASPYYGLLYLYMNDSTVNNGSNLYFVLNDSAGNSHEYAGLGGTIRTNNPRFLVRNDKTQTHRSRKHSSISLKRKPSQLCSVQLRSQVYSPTLLPALL
jgi:hypothetical protein